MKPVPRPSALAAVLALLSYSVATAAEDKPWEPPPPEPDEEFDWVQLTSGEWLKGEFRVMFEDEVKFESDKLGFLTLDWDDIKQVRTVKPLAFRFEPHAHADGTAVIDEESVVITPVAGVSEDAEDGDLEPTEFPREELVSVASGSDREIDLWAAEVSIGANYRSGNVDETEFSAMAEISRRTSDGRWRISYLGRYLETDEVETRNNHSATVRWDRYVTRRFFYTPVFAKYYRDPFQNIAHRASVGAGLGYRLVDNDRVEWTVSAGPAYRRVEYESSESGTRSWGESAALMMFTDFDAEVTDWLDFEVGYSGFAAGENAGGYGHTAIGTLSFSLGDPFEFNVSLLWDFLESPARTSDGQLPESDDITLMFGIGLEF